MNLNEQIRKMGFDTVPQSYYSYIEMWKQWYKGNVEKFHNYKIYNGQETVPARRYTLGMAKKVSEDWANLLLNEKVAVTLEGEKEQEFYNTVMSENNFDVKGNECQEIKSALGTVAYIVRVADAVADGTGAIMDGGKIKLEYVSGDNIYPLSWENGTITECAFSSAKTIDNEKYVYLQLHVIENGEYVIKNKLYENTHGDMHEVPTETVKGFEGTAPEIHTGSNKPMFVIDRLNIANNLDPDVPLGVSVYANAIDQLKGVDIAYDSYVNEFVLGKKRIMVKPETVQSLDGHKIFDPNDTIYYILPEDRADGSMIEPIDMTLRTTEHNRGLQDALTTLSSKCGFGERVYKFDSGNITTATQVISENSSLFRTIKKHEIILEKALIDLARIILRVGNTYLHAGLNEDVEVSVDFDDSIIEDKQSDFNRDIQLLNQGILNDWEFRAKWMNEDEETAKTMLPRMQDLTTEEQNEVE
jgi:A118 family predicted phage portal protein